MALETLFSNTSVVCKKTRLVDDLKRAFEAKNLDEYAKLVGYINPYTLSEEEVQEFGDWIMNKIQEVFKNEC